MTQKYAATPCSHSTHTHFHTVTSTHHHVGAIFDAEAGSYVGLITLEPKLSEVLEKITKIMQILIFYVYIYSR